MAQEAKKNIPRRRKGAMTVAEAGQEATYEIKEVAKHVAVQLAIQGLSYAAGMGVGYLLGKGFQLLVKDGA